MAIDKQKYTEKLKTPVDTVFVFKFNAGLILQWCYFECINAVHVDVLGRGGW